MREQIKWLCLFFTKDRDSFEDCLRENDVIPDKNEQITKQDDMADHKPKSNMNNYVYASGFSVFGLAICGYLLYNKFKKQEQNLIDVPPPPVPKTSTEPK